tara:strand:- start:1161 stop:1499 length:339 start_codon:yes stop_codon:yes gene_type:complete
MIKFNKYAVVNTETKVKVRVIYSLDNRCDERPCVTIYEKDYGRDLRKLFPDLYKNYSDSMIDYFESDKVVLFEGHELYKHARVRAEIEQIEKDKRAQEEDRKLAIRYASYGL